MRTTTPVGEYTLDLTGGRLTALSLPALIAWLQQYPAARVIVVQTNIGFYEACRHLLAMIGNLQLIETNRLAFSTDEEGHAMDMLHARAFLEGRTLGFSEVNLNLQAVSDSLLRVQQQQEAMMRRDAAMQQQHEEMMRRDAAMQQQHEAMMQRNAAMQQQQEATTKREAIIKTRIDGLEGYNRNAALCIEYAVTDAVDDLVQIELGYKLEDRMQRIQLYDKYGNNVGEIDGLLVYSVPGEGQRMVVVAVEAKSNMTAKEFDKVGVNIRHLEDAIAVGSTAGDKGDFKYRRLCASLSTLQGAKIFVAIGAPVVPAEITRRGADLEYLVVEGIREGQYKAVESSQWVSRVRG